ncbi:hypothetical protein OCU04_001489 [Sclerotinia nivalis]|uniref:Uncharacterized protein n=1 Tax=Sclerotinia nivalis TaxID=352851 RepID=A0A9X0DPS0_9HELO|nr:hypothetical protein OCU04_001489 [Sclerotinia nivalis]
MPQDMRARLVTFGSTTGHHYEPLAASKKHQRHRYHYHYCFRITASAIAFLGLYLIVLANTRQQAPPLEAFPDTALRDSRCLDFPADCEETAPFIFNSVYSLAKQWPNTYAPNGHTIVPVTFPRHIPLYHAKQFEGPLKKPTWFAFDAEMFIGIYGGSGITFLHAVLPSRKLNLLYFDGESATLTASGSLDSQTALLRQHIELNPSDVFTNNETARGQELCDLAREFGIDGFVRMNAGFEMLVCDLTVSGIQEIYVNNLTVPGNYKRENDPSLPRDPNRTPPLGFGNDFSPEYGWDWIRSASWHYGGAGANGGTHPENRINIDFCGIISYYDPSLRSLAGKHTGGIRGKEHYENGWGHRRGHRLVDISEEDARTIKTWVKQVLRPYRHASLLEKSKSFWQPLSICSENDWQLITELITDMHRGRALEIADAFRQFHSETKTWNATMISLHDLSHAVLVSQFEYPRADVLSLS